MKTGVCRSFVAAAVAFAGLATGAGALEVPGLPAPGAPVVARALSPREKTLPNGLQVVVVERRGLPLVSVELVIRSGSEADPPTRAGLAALTANLLTQGTTTRSATQIAREIESLGATLRARAEWDGSRLSLSTLSTQADAALAILADVARRPRFAAEEVERQRRQALDELRVALEEPRTVAALAMNRLLLGTGLYAHAVSGSPAALQRVQRREIVSFHQAHYTPEEAHLVLAGDLSAEEAFALAEKHFADWERRAPSQSPTVAAFTPAKTPRAVLIDQPKAGQSAVVVSAPGIARAEAGYFAGVVTNAVLGGGYTSRLNEEIRVKRGLSYGAGSGLLAWREGGLFSARCQTKHGSAAEVVQVILTELQRLGTESVPADYFAARRAALSGDFARDLETNGGYVTRLAERLMRGLPLDGFATYLADLEAPSAEDVRTFAAAHLAAEKMSVVVVGRASECAAALRAIFPKLEVIPRTELDLDSPTLRRSKRR